MKPNNRILSILLLTVMVCSVILSACSPAVQTQIVPMQESSLFPLGSQIESDKKDIILEYLRKYYMEDGSRRAFGKILLDQPSTKLLDVYYIVLLARNCGCLDDAIRIPARQIADETKTRLASSLFDSYKSLASIGLLHMLDIGNVEDYLQTFLTEYTDSDSGLLCEHKTAEDIETEMSFTVTAVDMLKQAGLSIDTTPYQEAVLHFYQNHEWKMPDNENDYISYSCCAPLYRMRGVGNPIDLSLHQKWYDAWKSFYDKPINDADQLSTYTFTLFNIADIFGDKESYQNKIKDALDKVDISSYLTYQGNPQAVSQAFRDVAEILNPDQVQILHDYCVDALNDITSKLIGYSPESNYHGLEIAQLAGYTVDIPGFVSTCEVLFDEKKQQYKDKKITLQTFIPDIYYYCLIGEKLKELNANGHEEIRDKVSATLKTVCKDISNETIRDPHVLRMLCTMVSQLSIRVDNTFKDTVESFVRMLYDNELVRKSTWMCELFTIDTVLSLGIITKDDVINALSLCREDGLYRVEEGVKPDVDTTFQVYAFCACFKEFEHLNADYAAMKTFVKDQLTQGIVDAKGIFEALCLLYYGEGTK